MISITTTTQQTNSAVIIRDYRVDSRLETLNFRVNKTKTLDGAVAVIHNGFVEGDRNLDVEGRLDETNYDILRDIATTETFVNIAISEGLFDGVIGRLENNAGKISMRLMLKEKLTS